MVFHLVRLGIGVGEDLAAGLDDGDARPRGRGSLASDWIQRCRRCTCDARSEHQRLLSQRSLNLAAQHALPGMADEQIKGNSTRRDDYQGREKQLQEDATLHDEALQGLGISNR